MKQCPDCRQAKSLSEFPRNKATKTGYAVYCKACHNARGRASKKRLSGGTRHYHLKRRYGIGADEVDALIAQQGGVCRICERRNPEHVDHDHDSGLVRGILCFNCNGGLGQFGDDVDRLQAAIEYLFDTAAPHRGDRELDDLARERARALVKVAF